MAGTTFALFLRTFLLEYACFPPTFFRFFGTFNNELESVFSGSKSAILGILLIWTAITTFTFYNRTELKHSRKNSMSIKNFVLPRSSRMATILADPRSRNLGSFFRRFACMWKEIWSFKVALISTSDSSPSDFPSLPHPRSASAKPYSRSLLTSSRSNVFPLTLDLLVILFKRVVLLLLLQSDSHFWKKQYPSDYWMLPIPYIG